MGYRGRDAQVVFMADQALITACDSCGAIGAKPSDVVQVSAELVGRFTARVALLEVLSTGATPQVLTATICNEWQPTGQAMLAGVTEELKACGLRELPMAISTEKNMVTEQTGLGISVVGTCPADKLRIATSQPGDKIYCLGLPKVGAEVTSFDDPEIIQGQHLQKLLQASAIHDLIPVGSQGIGGEARQLAATVGAEFKPVQQYQVNLEKSGGPSTCLIFSAGEEFSSTEFALPPLFQVGELG